MNINQERFPTYKPLSPVLRTQTTYLVSQNLLKIFQAGAVHHKVTGCRDRSAEGSA